MSSGFIVQSAIRIPQSAIKSPACQVGGAGAVESSIAQETAVEDGAAEPEVQIELPGEADTSVKLGRITGRAIEDVGEMRFGQGGVPGGLVANAVEGMGGVPVERQRGLQLGRQIGELVLDGLKGTDHLAELLAL